MLGYAELHTCVQSIEVGFETGCVIKGILRRVWVDMGPIELKHCVQSLGRDVTSLAAQIEWLSRTSMSLSRVPIEI